MRFRVWLIAVMMVALLAGVFAGGQGEAAPGEEEKIELRMNSWIISEMPEAMETFKQRFEEEYPNVTVIHEGVPYSQVLQQTIVSSSAGTAPDVIYLVANWTPQLAGLGVLEDLGPHFSEEELAEIPRAAYEDAVIDGTLRSMPNFLGTINVIAWKSLLREAGLPEEVPDTWEEFKEAIRTVSALGPETYGFGARTSKDFNSAFWFFPVLWGHGGNLEDENGNVLFNDPGTIAALEWYHEIGTEDQSPVGQSVIEVREMQAAGRVAFTLDGPWMQGWFRTLGGEALDDEYVAGLMPMAADGNRYGIANNHVMAVSSQSKAKDAAVNYIKFFTQSVEMNRIFHEDFGFIPVNRSVRAEVMDPDDPFFKPFIEAAEYSVAVPSDNPNLPGAMEFVAAAMQGAILGGDPEALAEQAHNGIRTLWQQ